VIFIPEMQGWFNKWKPVSVTHLIQQNERQKQSDPFNRCRKGIGKFLFFLTKKKKNQQIRYRRNVLQHNNSYRRQDDKPTVNIIFKIKSWKPFLSIRKKTSIQLLWRSFSEQLNKTKKEIQIEKVVWNPEFSGDSFYVF
jgi:hypothetical protein